MGTKVRSDPLWSVHFLGDFLESFLILGHGVEIVANNRPQSGVDVEDGLLEGEGVAVHLHLPLSSSETTEE